MTSEYTSKCMYLHIDICNCVYRKSRWLNKMGGGEIHKVSVFQMEVNGERKANPHRSHREDDYTMSDGKRQEGSLSMGKGG